MLISETWINRTRNIGIGESGVYDAIEPKGRLYRHLVGEYGRCISKVYIDTPKGPKAIGWVFQGRAKYTDTGETYLRETWVSLHAAPTETITKPHYMTLDGAEIVAS